MRSERIGEADPTWIGRVLVPLTAAGLVAALAYAAALYTLGGVTPAGEQAAPSAEAVASPSEAAPSAAAAPSPEADASSSEVGWTAESTDGSPAQSGSGAEVAAEGASDASS